MRRRTDQPYGPALALAGLLALIALAMAAGAFRAVGEARAIYADHTTVEDPALRPALRAADPCLTAPPAAMPRGCDPVGALIERVAK